MKYDHSCKCKLLCKWKGVIVNSFTNYFSFHRTQMELQSHHFLRGGGGGGGGGGGLTDVHIAANILHIRMRVGSRGVEQRNNQKWWLSCRSLSLQIRNHKRQQLHYLNSFGIILCRTDLTENLVMRCVKNDNPNYNIPCKEGTLGSI